MINCSTADLRTILGVSCVAGMELSPLEKASDICMKSVVGDEAVEMASSARLALQRIPRPNTNIWTEEKSSSRPIALSSLGTACPGAASD